MSLKVLDVVAGILHKQHQILIAKRPPDKPHPGLWEFPGGKRELGETAMQTLRRELMEEVGVQVRSALPLVTRDYDYADYTVRLQAWTVIDFVGEPQGVEGQELRWVAVEDLEEFAMPEANDFVMRALLDRSCYADDAR